MTPPPDHEERLEQQVQRALRDLPLRRAPRSLEVRVRAEIERRSALPWWHRSFAAWPTAARVGFLGLSLGLAGLAFVSGIWMSTGFAGGLLPASLALPAGWMESGLTVVRTIGGCLAIFARNVPPLWLYGALALFGTLYLTLFGLGAAAYKALHPPR